MAFIYQAAIYCDDCGRKIRADLDAAGKRPEDADDERSFDSDEYPKGPYSDGGGESDTPQHCDACHEALDNPLTSDGVEYVVESLREFVTDGAGDMEVLIGWARQLESYSLTKEQHFVVTAFRHIRSLKIQFQAKV